MQVLLSTIGTVATSQIRVENRTLLIKQVQHLVNSSAVLQYLVISPHQFLASDQGTE